MNRFEALMRRAALVLALLLTTACGGGEEEPRTPSAEPPREIEVDASSTLYGFVGDTAGNPVEGVVVSDGFQCVATDAGGVYEMKRNAAAEYVYYSVPAEFKIRTGHDGYPDFYVRLDTSQQKIRQDFTLERLAGVERSFRLICIGDPQPAKAEEATRFEREAMVDVRRTATGFGGALLRRGAGRHHGRETRPARGRAPFAGDGGHSGLRAAGQPRQIQGGRRHARATPPISATRWGRWTTRSTAATCTWSAWTT